MGGIESQTVLLARELMKLGIDVTVVTMGSLNRRAYTDLHVAALPWEIDVEGTVAALAATVGWLILLLKTGSSFTVLQAQSIQPMGMAVGVAGRMLKLPTVARMSSSGAFGEVRSLLRRPLAPLRIKILRWINAYVALHPTGVCDLPTDLRNRAVVIPNGVDCNRFRPPDPAERALARQHFGLNDEDVVYCYTGRLRSFKAIDELIVAWARCRPLHGILLIAGEGPEWKALQSMAVKAGLADSVVFTGALADVVIALWAADVFVQPSKVEGLSNSVLEAMACGLPVIARRLDYTKDLLERDCTFDDGAELEELIKRGSDARRRQERALYNLESVSSFDSGRMALRYLELYRKLGG